MSHIWLYGILGGLVSMFGRFDKMLCKQCFYNSDGRCINHCSLHGDVLENDLYGVLVASLPLDGDCTGFRPDFPFLRSQEPPDGI